MATVAALENAFNKVVERTGITLPQLWYTSVDALCQENNIDRDFLDWDNFTENWYTKYTEEELDNGFVEFHVYDYVFVLSAFDDDSVNEVVKQINEYLESRITCSVCGNTYNEEDVNIIDYDDDVCVSCEKSYQNIQLKIQ